MKQQIKNNGSNSASSSNSMMKTWLHTARANLQSPPSKAVVAIGSQSFSVLADGDKEKNEIGSHII